MKKIIVSADCNGQLEFLVKKVSALHAKNHFDFMLCLGRVMNNEECDTFASLKSGKFKLPVPVYFIESGEMAKTLNCLYPQGKEILPNLTYLGRAGLKTIEGVKVAYLNGLENDQHSNFYLNNNVDYSSGFYTTADIDQLCDEKIAGQSVDILLTNEWPEDNSAGAPQTITSKSQYVSRVADRVSPRYHFAGSEGIYFKRKEYLNRKGFATAFISIGSIKKDQQNKQKYLHAIQIVPLSELSIEKLEVAHETLDVNPFSFLQELSKASLLPSKLQHQQIEPNNKKADFKEPPIIYFEKFGQATHESQIQEFIERWGQPKRLQIFFDESKRRHKGSGIVVFEDVETSKKCLAQSGQYSLHGSRIRFSIKTELNQYTDKSCWFCKESGVFDETLVFHYGKQSYLALDKGPIVLQHFLVVPYKHMTSYGALDEQCKQQMFTVTNRLRNYFLTQGKDIIVFERFLNLSHSVNHYIRQCIPNDIKDIDRLAARFEKKCLNERLNFLKIQQVEFEEHVRGKFYFRVQFGETIYICIVKDRHFPIDFGRLVVCELLDLSERINWKSCISETKSKQQINKYLTILKEIHMAV